MEDDYNATVVWAEQEEQLRATRGQPVSNVYLFSLAFVFLGACLLVLYLLRREKVEPTTLDMVRDSNNILFEEFPVTEMEVDEEE